MVCCTSAQHRTAQSNLLISHKVGQRIWSINLLDIFNKQRPMHVFFFIDYTSTVKTYFSFSSEQSTNLLD